MKNLATMKNKIEKVFLFLLIVFTHQKVFAQFVEDSKEDNLQTTDPSFFVVNSATDLINFFFAIVFIISIIGFLFSGLRFLTAGGSETALESANRFWKASLTGLIVSLAGYIAIHVFKLIFS
jgi:hypothetical protein